jgi:CheY-like chemotaxis protein
VPKLLIVDDDRTTVHLLSTLLEMDGFDVSVTGRGAEVLTMVQQVRPDAILLDHHLADMDGIEVVKLLRSQPEYANLPIVMASGLDVSEQALAAGASRFLIKPYEPNELPRLLNELIAG